MENLSVEDRTKLENKIMEAITAVLEESIDNSDVAASDCASQSSSSGRSFQSKFDSVVSKSCPSVIQEARAAGLVAKLEAMKKKNALQNRISEQKSKLSEMRLEMEIEEAKAQHAVLSKYNQESKALKSNSELEPQPIERTANSKDEQTSTMYLTNAKYETPNMKDERVNSNDDLYMNHERAKSNICPARPGIDETEPLHMRDSIQFLRRLHLPKMTMETFDGDVMKFAGFLHQFENNILSKTDDDEERLYYLDQMTSGKPNDIVKTCLHLPPGEGYREARRLLDKRYGDKSQVTTTLVTKILAWPFIHRRICDLLRGCLNSLKNIRHGMADVDARIDIF